LVLRSSVGGVCNTPLRSLARSGFMIHHRRYPYLDPRSSILHPHVVAFTLSSCHLVILSYRGRPGGHCAAASRWSSALSRPAPA
jgi:hypothetical protein